MFASLVAVVGGIFTLGSISSQTVIEQSAGTRLNEFSLRCSATELDKVQRRWKWLMAETQTAQKVQLYRAVREFIDKRQPNVKIFADVNPIPEPVELTAYRMFSILGASIDSLRTKEKLISSMHYELLMRPERVLTARNAGSLHVVDAFINVVGPAILEPEELTSWEQCLTDMKVSWKFICESLRLHASCDVTTTSGDPDYPIHGTINFMQQVIKGRTTINIELDGFPPGNSTKKYGMHIHAGGTTEDRCKSAGSHFNPHSEDHGTPSDENKHVGDLGNIEVHRDGRVTHTKIDDGISLYGPNSIIGKTLVIHAMEDDLGRGGNNDVSKTTGPAGGRTACCVIYQIYD
jgi:Cu-Zn family superoxide dismutase